MPGPWKPDMKKYRYVKAFGLKANADNYVKAGWEFIETRTDLIGNDAAIVTYRVGWLRANGEPVFPPEIEEDPSAYPQNNEPSMN
jgi:hypothetical protein